MAKDSAQRRTRLQTRLAFFLFTAILFLPGHCWAAEAGAPKKVPTTINSGRMDYDANAQTVLFSGNVHVKRPDFELWSDKMTVYLDKSGGDSAASEDLSSTGMEAGDIDRIVAEGNVRMKSENRKGTCKKATYYTKTDRFVMEGSPVLMDDKQSTISGGTIVHYFGTNRSEVLRGAGVTFYAPDKTEESRKPGTSSAPRENKTE